MFFFFNDTATTEIYTLSLHDALPISRGPRRGRAVPAGRQALQGRPRDQHGRGVPDEIGRSTRLNSSHLVISYAVFCLKKKKQNAALDAAVIDIHVVRSRVFVAQLAGH